MTKATVFFHSDRIEEACPVLDGSARTQFKEAAKAANGFSEAVLEWLGKKEGKVQAAWLRTCVNLSRDLLQPWTMEVLFLLSVMGPVRFTELQKLLGVSSRTLSDRLKLLKEAGFVDRKVHDEQPVRVEYSPTRQGRQTASLASPLIAHLGIEALKAAGKV